MLCCALEEKGHELEERCALLRGAIDQAGSLMEISMPSDVQGCEDTDRMQHQDNFERKEDSTGDLSKNAHSVWDYVKHVQIEIRNCEAEMLRIKLDAAEKEQRARDLEQQEQARQAARLQEIERRQKEEEANREDLLKRQQRRHMELLLQQRSPEKRTSVFRKPFVSPITNRTLVEDVTASPPVFSGGEDSMAVMEYEVQRLLEDESPVLKRVLSPCHSFPSSDANLTAKGVLERLEDPWDVQSSENSAEMNYFPTLDPPTAPKLQPSLCLGLDFRASHTTTRMDPLEALLVKKRLLDSLKMQHQLGLARTQTMPTWNRSVSMGSVSRRTMPLDSSAPAFYPKSSTEVPPPELGAGIHPFSSPMKHVSPTSFSATAAQRLQLSDQSIPKETSRPIAGPFPGVGVGIPGTPRRSLSERMDPLQLSTTMSEKEGFSRSGEL